MLYMLDTDICSYIMKFKPIPLLSRLQEAVEKSGTICISVITYSELRLGAERSQAVDRYNGLIHELVERLDLIEPWTTKQADLFAILQARMMKLGQPIGHNDTMIAAHARSIGATLVTNNHRHFSRVPDLKLENWANENLQ